MHPCRQAEGRTGAASERKNAFALKERTLLRLGLAAERFCAVGKVVLALKERTLLRLGLAAERFCAVGKVVFCA